MADVAQYEKWYESSESSDGIKRLTDDALGLNDAFQVEYGLTPEQAFNAVKTLRAFGSDRGRQIVQSTIGKVLSWTAANRIHAVDDVKAFLASFSLSHRAKWDTPPNGYLEKDIWPWRYNRRLSYTFKPMLVDGLDPDHGLHYNIRDVAFGLGILIDRLVLGHMPQEFVVTEKMKSFLGRVDQQKGLEFEHSVADQFKSLGWSARTRVSMTTFGADGRLGDVDVLAWHGCNRLWVIECKRLQLARTVKEIAETCQRFADDELGQAKKHSRRVRWMREYSLEVCRELGLDSDQVQICPRFVTNIEVPMKYLKNLPRDIGEVGPLSVGELTP